MAQNLERLTKLWNLTRKIAAARDKTLEHFQEELAEHFKDFRISTPAHFQRLKDLADGWTGFGTTLSSELGLFFKGPRMTDCFPDGVLDREVKTVEGMNFRPISSGTSEFTPCEATPGAEVSWSGGQCRLSPHSDHHGTLGMFLKDEAGRTWILSANHVLGLNGDCASTVVNLPGCCEVSHNTRAVPIKDYGTLNFADAAVALWDAALPPHPQIAGMHPLTDKIASPEELRDKNVIKVGRPNRRIEGHIAYIGECVLIDLRDDFHYQAQFAKQILIADIPREDKLTFSHGGDSGSLVVHDTGAECRPVGILIANNAARENDPPPANHYSVVTPLGAILAELHTATGQQFQLMT